MSISCVIYVKKNIFFFDIVLRFWCEKRRKVQMEYAV